MIRSSCKKFNLILAICSGFVNINLKTQGFLPGPDFLKIKQVYDGYGQNADGNIERDSDF
jgi:hypothetical protein